ncbi:MAG: hypothetical protein OEY29_00265 [Gammaproteobacteria bacterium]|nr:hypothetical protein [Gammaproteobacteria bacterium]
MKGNVFNPLKTPRHQSQDHCPPKKHSHTHTEISLETLEILLTSLPDDEAPLTDSTQLSSSAKESQRKYIEHVIEHKQHYLKRLQHLLKRKRGVEWLYRNLSYFQTQFPWELISLLENMAHQSASEVSYITPLATSEHQPPPLSVNNYSQVIIGELEGLRVLTTNIRRLIFNNLETPLQQLTAELINHCTAEELSHWSNWCEDIESHIREIEELVQDGQKFFSIRNFRLMEQLPISKRSASTLKAIIDKASTS